MISFELSEELAMVQSTARELANEKIRPAAREAEALGAVPDALARTYLDLGFAAVELPEAIGGLGLGLVGRTIVEEELAFGDAAIALGMPAPGAFAEIVLALGTEAQRADLAAMIERQGRGALAWTDAHPRSGTFATIAEEQEDGSWSLTGVKAFVVNGHLATALAVFAEARPRHGARRPAAFRVDPGARGVHIAPQGNLLGLSAAPPATITFERVAVPAGDRLLGAGDRFDARTVLALARIGLVGAAREVGLAAAAHETARAYAAERSAFGKPIAHFQAVAFMAADMATEVEVMRQVVRRAAFALDRDAEDALRLAAMAIAECHEGAMRVTNDAVQLLGGSGYIRDYPVEKWMRDARAHMGYGLPRQLCDLLVGRMALEGGGPLLVEDAPMPELQPVMT